MRSLLLPRRRHLRSRRTSPLVSHCTRRSSIAPRPTDHAPSFPSAAAAPTLSLTPAEDSLFSFLVYIQHVYTPQTQLRVAGGWVRDKLRGVTSADIDIVLDNVNGATFARWITDFQRSRRLAPSSVGLVPANAPKSKHLQVATVQLAGATVDLVQLRTEHYTPTSRVPVVAHATPAADARRRDFTINALFYNLQTRQVEDWTGRGVLDLDAGIVRTPLDPAQTFLDDPLRVLRAVRFACALGFTLDPAVAIAVRDQRAIVDALRRKVSRERIGIEVRKMLSGQDPARAFRLLSKWDLLDVVFNDATAAASGTTTDEGDEAVNVQAFPYLPREWTVSIQTRACHYLHYLQRSRLALAQCTISNVESTAAIFAPLFLQKLPSVVLDGLARARRPIHEELDGITEQEFIASSLAFLARRDQIAAALGSCEIVEMLKVHVKWPKPAGKRVALIIEAIATYPEGEPHGFAVGQSSKGDHESCHRFEGVDLKLRVQQFMWTIQYYSVLAPAMTILVSDCSYDKQHGDKVDPEKQEAALKAYLDLANSYIKSDGQTDKSSQSRRLDGEAVRTRLGPGARKGIAQALCVLQVWEKIYPNASMEDELAFLDRLAPLLRADSPEVRPLEPKRM